MAGNTFGTLFSVNTFGESHGPALGVTIDGLPAGIKFDLDFIQSEMNRRRPGANSLGTTRNEGDEIEVISGVFEGYSTGCPITMIIKNTSQKSQDYSAIKDVFRPGHADYTYTEKFGIRDYRGGGRSSGRETSMRVAAGAVAKLLLKEIGINIKAGTIQIGNIKAKKLDFDHTFNNELSCPDEEAAILMRDKIKDAKDNLDSIGGIIECHVSGMLPGLGDPCFDKLDALLAHAILSIGACKGFEIGSGFESAKLYGSQNNDKMHVKDGKVTFDTNNAGGILGGISNGNDIIFRAAFKPTPSIYKEQETINKSLENVKIQIKGRHDPCIVPRAVVVVEAMTAIVLADRYLVWRAYESR